MSKKKWDKLPLMTWKFTMYREDEKGNQKDACVISRDYNKADHYYIFNHVDIIVTYHNGRSEDWGKYFSRQLGSFNKNVKLINVGKV